MIDLPPGTGDIQQQLVALLPVMAAVVVVTPQDVAHLDAKRVLELFRGCGIRILGAVENMSDLICPHCGSQIDLFPPVQNERSIWEERRALEKRLRERAEMDRERRKQARELADSRRRETS